MLESGDGIRIMRCGIRVSKADDKVPRPSLKEVSESSLATALEGAEATESMESITSLPSPEPAQVSLLEEKSA